MQMIVSLGISAPIHSILCDRGDTHINHGNATCTDDSPIESSPSVIIMELQWNLLQFNLFILHCLTAFVCVDPFVVVQSVHPLFYR